MERIKPMGKGGKNDNVQTSVQEAAKITASY